LAEGQITVREAARRGGLATRDKIGSEGYAAIGRKGGATTRSRYGTAHYAEIGRKGGSKISAKDRSGG
jgi:general stress protein YciG